MKFKVEDLVRTRKEKIKFSKGYDQTFSTEIFRAVKVTHSVPQPVYEPLVSLNRPIEDHFYNYEIVNVPVSPQS